MTRVLGSAIAIGLLWCIIAPATAATDACKLLTKTDVQAVMKARVTSQSPVGPEAGCQYMLQGEGSFPGSVSLQLHAASKSDYETYLNTSKSELKVSASPISGLGEKAAWSGGRVIVYAKNQLWIVTGGLPGMPQAAQRSALTALARRALAHG